MTIVFAPFGLSGGEDHFGGLRTRMIDGDLEPALKVSRRMLAALLSIGWSRLVTLEVLHFPLVFLGGGAGAKRSEVSSLAGARIELSRVKPKLSGRKLSDHVPVLSARRWYFERSSFFTLLINSPLGGKKMSKACALLTGRITVPRFAAFLAKTTWILALSAV
jgi:hypothetical protein